MNSIQYIKLSNGSELIGEVVYEDTMLVSIKDALSVEQIETQEGLETIVLFPYSAFNKYDRTDINANLVITKYYINEILKEYYKLSLSFAKIHQQRIDKMIDQVNSQMRDQLYEMADDEMFGKYSIQSKAIN